MLGGHLILMGSPWATESDALANLLCTFIATPAPVIALLELAVGGTGFSRVQLPPERRGTKHHLGVLSLPLALLGAVVSV